jgi:hypothetical protein
MESSTAVGAGVDAGDESDGDVDMEFSMKKGRIYA